MRFRNDIHKRRFEKEIKTMDKKDNAQMAIVFLLTANLKLWNRCKIYMIDNKIPSGIKEKIYAHKTGLCAVAISLYR